MISAINNLATLKNGKKKHCECISHHLFFTRNMLILQQLQRENISYKKCFLFLLSLDAR